MDMNKLILPALIIGCCLLVSLAFSGQMDLLCLGDSMAVSLGVRVKQLRMICMVCASASAAAVVSFAGLLGFVGLVVPHIARRLARQQHTLASNYLRICRQHTGAAGGLAGADVVCAVGAACGRNDGHGGRAVFFALLCEGGLKSMMTFERLSASYGKNKILEDVCFPLIPHKITAVIGKKTEVENLRWSPASIKSCPIPGKSFTPGRIWP